MTPSPYLQGLALAGRERRQSELDRAKRRRPHPGPFVERTVKALAFAASRSQDEEEAA